MTGLPSARWLLAIIAVAGAHEVWFGGATAAFVTVLAVGAAIVPSAIVRAALPTLTGGRRHAVTLAFGVPLVLAALAIGPTIVVDDPAATPTQLAFELATSVPPGPGVFVATRSASWLAASSRGKRRPSA